MARECPIFTDKVGVSEFCGGAWLDFTDPSYWTTDFNKDGEDIGGGSNDLSVYGGCPSSAADGHFGWDGSTAWIGMSHASGDFDMEQPPPRFATVFDRFRPVGGWEAGFRPSKMRITYQFIGSTGSPADLPGTEYQWACSLAPDLTRTNHKFAGVIGTHNIMINVAVCDDGAANTLGQSTGRRQDFYRCHGRGYGAGIIGGRDRGDGNIYPVRSSIELPGYPGAPTYVFSGCPSSGYELDGYYWGDYRPVHVDQLQTVEIPLDWTNGQTDIGYVSVEAFYPDQTWYGLLRCDIVKIEFFDGGAAPDDVDLDGSPTVKGAPYVCRDKNGNTACSGGWNIDTMESFQASSNWGVLRTVPGGGPSFNKGFVDHVLGGEDYTQVTFTFGSLNITKTDVGCYFVPEIVWEDQYNVYDMQWDGFSSPFDPIGYTIFAPGSLSVGSHNGLKITLDLRKVGDGSYDLEAYSDSYGKPRRINVAGGAFVQFRNDISGGGGATADNVTVEFGVATGTPGPI